MGDIRFALRYARKAPGFVTVAIFSLALGIGANLTIFSLVNGLMLRPMPAVRPSELVNVYARTAGADYSPLSFPDYRRYRERAGNTAEITAYQISNFAIGSGRDAELRAGMFVDDNYFRVLGTRPLAGRFPLLDEREAGTTAPEVMLGARVAAQRFGHSAAAVGRTIDVNGVVSSVVGVAPRELQPVLGLSMDVFAPLGSRRVLEPASGPLDDENVVALSALGRLGSGITMASAQRELDRIALTLDQVAPRLRRGLPELRAVRLAEAGVLPPAARVPLRVVAVLLFTVTGLVLLLACTNLANLLLARASERRRELAVRAALGASRARIIRQLVVEGLLLSLAAAIAGVGLARVAVIGLLTVLPASPVPLMVEVAPDTRAVAVATVLAGVAALLFTLVPAWSATGLALPNSLKESTAGAGTTIGQVRQRRRLIVAQVMIATVLLIAAGLFVRSLARAQSLDPGFVTGRVLLATVDASRRFPDPEQGAQFYERLIVRLSATPGVRAATVVQRVPLDFGNQAMVFQVEDGARGGADYNVVGSGYFATLGIPIRSGRDFSRDGPSAGEVIINETLAHRYFGGASALGRRMTVGGGKPQWLEVVGVVKDGKYRSLSEPPQPFFFLSFRETYRPEMTLAIATDGEPSRFLPQLREALAREDPSMPLYMIRSLREHMHGSLLPARLAGNLLGALGVLTLILAGLGIYGVMTFSTQMRRGEIGLRLALGADRRSVLELVFRQGMVPVAIGLGAGLVTAFLVGRGLTRYLYGVAPADPLTFAGVTVIIALVAGASCLIPAWRVAATQPSIALRQL